MNGMERGECANSSFPIGWREVIVIFIETHTENPYIGFVAAIVKNADWFNPPRQPFVGRDFGRS
jgi:hypothetical protein